MRPNRLSQFLIGAVLVAAIGLMLTACGKKQARVEPAPEAVAQVGSESITFDAVRTTAAHNGHNLTKKEEAEKALRDAVNLELLAAEAEKLGYTKEPSIRHLVKSMAVQKLVSERVDAEMPKQDKLGEEELRAYYEAHKEEFSQPTLARAQLLFVMKRDGGAEALAKKNEDVTQALANGVAFGEIVKRFSDNPSVQADGGVTNWLIKGQSNVQYPPELLTAIFGSPSPDHVFGPVETTQGFYWGKIVEKREGKVTPFEEARGQIAQRVAREKRLELYDKYVEKLKKDHPVSVFPERLEKALESSQQQTGPPMGPVRLGTTPTPSAPPASH